MEEHPDNTTLLGLIEAAAFIICLDDASPISAEQRALHFLCGESSNRWNDKAIQFIVCSNGVSAVNCEHSQVEGPIIGKINEVITDAILKHKPDDRNISTEALDTKINPLTSLTFKTSPQIQEHIERIRQEYALNTQTLQCCFPESTYLNKEFLRIHKYAPNSTVQVAIQLACSRFYAEPYLAQETVSQKHFRGGRIDLNHLMTPELFEFCKAANNSTRSTKTNLRKLLIAAVRAHAKSLMRASRGHGITRYNATLKYMLRDGEEVPALLKDPIFCEEKPFDMRVLTDCMEAGVLEVGTSMMSQRSLWIHFETNNQRYVRFRSFQSNISSVLLYRALFLAILCSEHEWYLKS